MKCVFKNNWNVSSKTKIETSACPGASKNECGQSIPADVSNILFRDLQVIWEAPSCQSTSETMDRLETWFRVSELSKNDGKHQFCLENRCNSAETVDIWNVCIPALMENTPVVENTRCRTPSFEVRVPKRHKSKSPAISVWTFGVEWMILDRNWLRWRTFLDFIGEKTTFRGSPVIFQKCNVQRWLFSWSYWRF